MLSKYTVSFDVNSGLLKIKNEFWSPNSLPWAVLKYTFIKNMGVNTAYCSDMTGTQEFNCICYAGFEGRRCENDLCDGVTCEKGLCDAGNCICDSSFINIDNICVETCDLNPCEVFQNKHTI